MAGRAARPLRHRKARDRAVILPLVGALLFLPPVAAIFRIDAAVGGIPLLVLYIFAVWAGLIVAAALLAPRLRESDAAVDDAVDDAVDEAAADAPLHAPPHAGEDAGGDPAAGTSPSAEGGTPANRP